jgi:nicotinamidase-related amidase
VLINSEKSCLLNIDVQERLMTAVHEGHQVIENCAWLITVATRLNIPVLLSEQYPRGLGHTEPTLLARVPADAIMEKVHFSCAEEAVCMDRINAGGREQIILTGAEAHVCVLQTALGLLTAGKQVFVVADCIGSRHPRNLGLALERMRAEGVRIVSREMVVFEWLHRAGTEVFREISREFLR